MIRFFAPGVPQTKGSHRIVRPPRAARPLLLNDNPKEKAWAAVVSLAARDAMLRQPLDPIEGPVTLRLAFQFERPKYHRTATGKLRRNVPLAPDTKPDYDKIARSVGDALTGICYHDDSQIVTALITKRWTCGDGVGAMVGVVIEVQPWPAVSQFADEESPFDDEEGGR